MCDNLCDEIGGKSPEIIPFQGVKGDAGSSPLGDAIKFSIKSSFDFSGLDFPSIAILANFALFV